MKTLLSTLTIVTLLAAAPAFAGHDDANEPAAPHDHSQMDHGSMDHSKMDHSGHEDMAPAGEAKPLNAECADTVNVKVDGLVCDFCARALEKVFGKRDDVEGIRVDLDNGNVAVAMKPGQTIDDATLTELITDSGYNVRSIERGCDE